ncbi:MAG: PQQ-binding-like beta-propeller repeat protein [Armatimonas sp.]
MRSALKNSFWTFCAATVALSTSLAILPLSGCGAGGGHNAAASRQKNGEITFTLTWPQPSRLIPLAANSIQLRLFRGATEVATPVILNKPENYTSGQTPVTVTTAFSGLEVGSTAVPVEYTIRATAFPQRDAAGNPQAAGQTAAAAIRLTTENPSSHVPLTMGSTITRLVVTPAVQDLRIGDTLALTATAFDASNNVVLTTPSQILWTVSNSAAATITPTGNPATLTASSLGTTNVTAQDNESKVTSTAAVVNVITTGLAQTNWPKFHGNSRNTGEASAGPAIASTPSLVAGWPAQAANVEFSSPTIGPNGAIYIGSTNGRLFAFNPNGSERWSVQTGGAIEGAPMVGINGIVYVASGDGSVTAFRDNVTSAEAAWSNSPSLAGRVNGSLTMDRNGFIYAASESGGSGNDVASVDSLNGVVRWAIRLGDSVLGSPALNAAEDTLVVTTGAGRVVALNSQTGTVRWTFQMDGTTFTSSPVIGTVGGAETVFATTQQGFVYALDAASGTEVWLTPFDTQGQVFGTPALSSDGRLCVTTYDNVSGLDENRLWVLDASAGQAIVVGEVLPAGVVSSPALSADGSQVYVGCYDGKLYGIDTLTGAVSWTVAPAGVGVDEFFDSSFAISTDGKIYIGGASGSVYALAS